MLLLELILILILGQSAQSGAGRKPHTGLLLLSARPVATFPVCLRVSLPFGQLYCLATEAHLLEQIAECQCMKVKRLELSETCDVLIASPTP